MRTPASAARISATASTSRPTPARPGSAWGSPTSEHIGKILIDPRNSNVVYVAAQGPLWSAGGERGLYKTTDGGTTWKARAHDQRGHGRQRHRLRSEEPGRPLRVDVSAAPRRRPDDRRRPGGRALQVDRRAARSGRSSRRACRKTTSAASRSASTPKKPTRGLRARSAPSRRSGLLPIGRRRARAGAGRAAAPPTDAPDAATRRRRSGLLSIGRRGRGVDAHRQARRPPEARGGGAPAGGRGPADDIGIAAAAPHYYHEIFVDPHRPDTIWSVNTNLELEHGRRQDLAARSNFENTTGMHVDYHVVGFDPTDPQSHPDRQRRRRLRDRTTTAQTWRFFASLPVTQFYRVSVDNAKPFYHVCGGAQDNWSQCGPSRTTNRWGIRTSDWYIVGGGDGFQTRSDPEDPNIVYASVAGRRHHAPRSAHRRVEEHSSARRRGGGRRRWPQAAAGADGQRADAPAGTSGAPGAEAPAAVGRIQAARGSSRSAGRTGGRGGRAARRRRRRDADRRTGTRRTSSARTRDAALLGEPTSSIAATIAATTGRAISPDLTRNLNVARAADHGQGLAGRRVSRITSRRPRSATSCRSTSRRCSKG